MYQTTLDWLCQQYNCVLIYVTSVSSHYRRKSSARVVSHENEFFASHLNEGNSRTYTNAYFQRTHLESTAVHTFPVIF